MTGKEDVDISALQQDAAIKESEPKLDDDFVKDHIPMVEAIVAGITGTGKIPPGVDFEEMVSWGLEGLLKAHKNFKANKGSKFKTYAYYRIKGEILDKIRVEWRYRNPADYNEHRRRIQERIADVAEQALDNADGNPNTKAEESVNSLLANSAVVCLMSLENVEVESNMQGFQNPEIEFVDKSESVLWEEIGLLDDDEQQIVEMFYVKGLKQKEIAQEMNYSRSTICRMHMKILDKLKGRLETRKTEYD